MATFATKTYAIRYDDGFGTQWFGDLLFESKAEALQQAEKMRKQPGFCKRYSVVSIYSLLDLL